MIVAITSDIETFEQGARLETAVAEPYSLCQARIIGRSCQRARPPVIRGEITPPETGEPVAEAYRSEALLVDSFRGMMPGQHRFKVSSGESLY